MTVAVRLKQLEAKRAQLLATECADCGHPYADHGPLVRCWYPRVVRDGVKNCRCRKFIDPAETRP